MEELIGQYLFQHKACPLPLVGSLRIKDGNAVAWHGDNKMSAPLPRIEFLKAEIPADQFISYIAASEKISIGEASLSLQKYCLELQQLTAYKEMKIEHAGRFYLDHSGNLLFKQDALPKEFFPVVSIRRVERSKPVSHNIRVGDNERTSEQMAEYYNARGIVKKERWWIAALIIFVVAAVVLAFYFTDHSYRENFGNVQPVVASPQGKTYRTK